MDALKTLLPVFSMMILGFICRIKGWITPEEKEGANKIVFTILFPIMIFNILFTSTIKLSALPLILFVTIAWMIVFFIGKLLSPWIGKEYKHIAPYMLTTVEGGNVALPLYISIVGSAFAINTVTFDLAGTIIAFIIYPIIVAKKTAGNVELKALIKNIFSSSFIIAVILGLVLNFSGFHAFFSKTQYYVLYSETLSMMTAPIVGMILFIIGFDFKLDKETLSPILKLMSIRLISSIIIQVLLLTLFTLTKEMQLAVLLYFLCPSGFAVPMLISPLFKNKNDASFLSSFISLYMVITLIVYTVLVIVF